MPCLPTRSLARLALAGLASLGMGMAGAAAAVPASPSQLQALEAALNSPGDAGLRALLQAGPGLDPARIEQQHRLLRQRFPDARWRVTPGNALRSGRPTVLVRVEGSRRQGSHNYRLRSEQLLSLESNGRLINGQTVLREQALLHSGSTALPVSLLIPDAVLTGQRYDVDVIFDEPLEGALVAGGIAAVSNQDLAALASPDIELGALGGGGLFKTVQAPLTAGSQTWAVLLVHPDGIITATKRVRVVADRQSLQP